MELVVIHGVVCFH